MEVADVGEPGGPGPGQVLVAPEAVGLCGSDFHYFLGDIGTIDDPSSLYPRIQGHEAAGTIVEVGADCPGLATGMRVALWPVSSCGHCYACRIGRGNACSNISLIGVHADGALQEQLLVPAAQAFPVGDQDPALAALIEPVSIAMRAAVRGRVAEGEHVVVLGAGPIGQALALVVTDLGASVLLVDTVGSRLARGGAMGADVLQVSPGEEPRRRGARVGRAGRAGGRVRGDGRPRAGADRDRAGRAGWPRGRRQPLRRAGAGPGRRPAVPGDRRARHELLRLGRVRRRRSSSSGDGAMPRPGSSRTSSRSSRRRRRWPTRSRTRPR